MSWPTVTLGEVAEWGSGGTPSRGNRDFYGGEIPWATIGDLTDGEVTYTAESITEAGLSQSSAKLVQPGAVLIAMYGSIGKLGIPTIPLATNQAIAFAYPGEHLDLRFLFHYLRGQREQLLAAGNGGTQSNISQTKLKAWTIPLPPLPEQRRIAAILDHADTLRTKRRKSTEQLNEFSKAVFVDMFGDPVTNPLAWELKPLGQFGILDRGVSRHRPRNDPALLGGPYPLVQTGEVANSGGYIRQTEQSYSELGLKQSKLWPSGTLCITIAANIAKTGILKFDACFPDSVVGFKPITHPIDSEYVRVWLTFLQSTLEASAPESAQKNINLAILRALPIPVPPVELRRRFDARLQHLNRVADQASESASTLDALFSSLQSRAFRGEL